MSKLLKVGWHIVLQWIPSHAGVDDNDKADELAMLRQPSCPLSYTAANLQSTPPSDRRSVVSINIAEIGKTGTAVFKIITGHDNPDRTCIALEYIPPTRARCATIRRLPANLSTEDDILKETAHFYWSVRHLMVNLPTVDVRWLVRNFLLERRLITALCRCPGSSFITSVPLYPSHDPEYTVNRLDTYR
ncbi:hypothetical protein J6590_096432 [Homalodisca vitripennis]|nr:hypothetical protein J6590_096432 [Homalodisca vitripennis]